MDLVKILMAKIEIINQEKKKLCILLYRCRHSYKVYIDLKNGNIKKLTNYNKIFQINFG